MPIPLYGFLEGDTLGLLVLAEEVQTILELARKLQDAANIRVARHDDVELFYNGKTVDPRLTVAQAGLQALDRFDVIWRHRV
jgi:Toluene-4-monooxygenase system protein B (TmoB)